MFRAIIGLAFLAACGTTENVEAETTENTEITEETTPSPAETLTAIEDHVPDGSVTATETTVTEPSTGVTKKSTSTEETAASSD